MTSARSTGRSSRPSWPATARATPSASPSARQPTTTAPGSGKPLWRTPRKPPIMLPNGPGLLRRPTMADSQNWPLYEVFLRGKRGLNHVHVGSLHAADPQMALRHARDLYTRRNEGVSIWVVAAADITASSPDEKDPFFAPSGDKVYRHPTFYQLPDDIPHM